MNKISKTTTIFDLTEDQDVLFNVLGFAPDANDKHDYIENATLAAKATDMLEFAEITKNEKLKTDLEAMFSGELLAFFNE